MAESQTLKLKFDTMSGAKTWSFKNADSSATLEQIKTLGSTMIANASLFDYQPVKLTDARIVTVTESSYDLDS